MLQLQAGRLDPIGLLSPPRYYDPVLIRISHRPDTPEVNDNFIYPRASV